LLKIQQRVRRRAFVFARKIQQIRRFRFCAARVCRLHRHVGMSGRRESEQGFTLVEVLVSATIFIVASAGIAQLTAVAIARADTSRARTATSLLAAQKMEQLRSLIWMREESGAAQSDTSTDVSRDPFASGGHGLAPSPAGTLEGNVDGYVDFLDASGRWVGAGTTPPAEAVYVRRWAVLPLSIDPLNSRVLIVLASTIQQEHALARHSGPRPRLPADSVLISLRTRTQVTR
jgi:type II secretory pathway pseudopilin PulG